MPAETLHRLIDWCLSARRFSEYEHPMSALVEAVERLAEMEGRTPEIIATAARTRHILDGNWQVDHRRRKLIARLEQIEDDSPKIPLESGEAWSDMARQDIAQTTGQQFQAWLELLTACRDAASAAPSTKWIKAARSFITQIGEAALRSALLRWFPLTASPRTRHALNEMEWQERCMGEELSRNYQLVHHGLLPGRPSWEYRTLFLNAAKASGNIWTWLRGFSSQPEVAGAYLRAPPAILVPPEPPPYDAVEEKLLLEPHMDILRGLAWVAGLMPGPDMARALTALALSAYRKVPGKGPRAVRVGNACITALSMMGGLEAVGQLAVLKVKVKFGTAQAQIEKALIACAEKSGIPRDELEEMSVPAYGLTEVGRGVERLGEFTAELLVAGVHEVALVWRGHDGKEKKSLPAAVKTQFKEELKELAAAKKDIERMLPAQAERLDALFLARKSWALEPWLEHYIQHPLVGVLARRLIWNFTTGGVTTPGIWVDDKLVDRTGAPVSLDAALTRVSLWQPLDQSPDVVLGWRGFLEEWQIRQPFKQAHREIYLLTPAEAETVNYSNRFAAHMLRQHQFNALCAARGWKNKLRLMVDDSYPPASRTLPQWGLRAEFWVEGAGDNFGTDTNESGVYLHVATDQVRFYRMEAAQPRVHAYGGSYEGGGEPLRLAEVPRLVFSEIMRDVDLFVGVASVGNDPMWRDGGRHEAFGQHWQHFAFGDLSATAQTRRDVLQRLVPKLKIAGQCSFEDKFLLVRGKLHTYKIHLGSGNILMSPNDQYLCIVASRGKSEPGNIFLPFEGDAVLSIILSKALLLAADDKITDPAITRQL